MINMIIWLDLFTILQLPSPFGAGTGNREQGTGNREQGTGNREQGTGNRELLTEKKELAPNIGFRASKFIYEKR
jgi:hypothetical protein